MPELNKILYIVVVEDEDDGGKNGKGGSNSFRYTHAVLQSILQVMGCKTRHAFKISKRVFGVLTSQSSRDTPSRMRMNVADSSNIGPKVLVSSSTSNHMDKTTEAIGLAPQNNGRSKNLSSELYKRRTTACIGRAKFLDVVCDALADFKYLSPNQREDLALACRLRERKESVTILLCGTSGCGKSTLSSLLASRLGITTVVSTDSIRHMMRSFVDEKDNQLLWASTYHAGECLDPVAVAEAKARRQARKKAGMSYSLSKDKLSDTAPNEKSESQKTEAITINNEMISPKRMAIEGFKAQSEMVIESLDRLITAWEERRESVIVEGVHLSLNFVMGLMKKHPSIIPFMIYITNEGKHLERFAVRAKYMTLDPEKNKYVKYIRNIRRIQDYLCNRADKHLVPKINNTNVDKSVATIHATVFSCLRRREAKEQLYDASTNTASVINQEYRNQCVADSLSSKGMLQLIQRKGSSRHLMALVDNNGNVTKAWPVDCSGGNDKPNVSHGAADSGMRTPMYGPLKIGKAESVNLQFGHYGLSAWANDTGSVSYASSYDESKTDWNGTETGSRCYSSCCSSPRMTDAFGAAKQLKEDLSVSGSEEECDDPPEADSDDDHSDQRTYDEIEGDWGSVDEGSIKSDEEYNDLDMQEDQENSYSYDEDEESGGRRLPPSGNYLSAFIHNNNRKGKIYPPTMAIYLRTQSGHLPERNSPRCSNVEKGEKRTPHAVSLRKMKRSFSIPAARGEN